MGCLSHQRWAWQVSFIHFCWEGFFKSVTMFIVKETAGAPFCCCPFFSKTLETRMYTEHFVARPWQYGTDVDPQTHPGIPGWLQWAPTFFWVSDQHTSLGSRTADQSPLMVQLMDSNLGALVI